MKTLLSTLFLLLYIGTLAQPYFRHYEGKNGLSHNTVLSCIQDKDGFMWFGTNDGLNRFDGYHFKTFLTNADNSSILDRKFINCLAVDSSGELWIGGGNGLSRFDKINERTIAVVENMNIIKLLVDRQNRLWFLSYTVFGYYDLLKGTIQKYTFDKFFFANSMCQAPNGTLWFGSSDGWLWRFDNDKGFSKISNLFSHSPHTTSLTILRIVADKYGNLYAGTTSQGVKKFDIATLSYKDIITHNLDKSIIYVHDITPINDTTYWIATETGILIFNPKTNNLSAIKRRYLDPYSLSDNIIWMIYQDREGGIWACTYYGGINYIPKQHISFQKFYPGYSGNSIEGSVVRDICQDQSGNIWIATENGGVNRLDLATTKIKNFLPTGGASSISYLNIHGLMAVNNELWVGTAIQGLDVMDIHTGKVKKHYSAGPNPGDLKSNFIGTFLQSKKGIKYIGTSYGLFSYNTAKDNFTPVAESILQYHFITSIIEDKDNNIWVGTLSNGVYIFNPRANKIMLYKNDSIDKKITKATVTSIYQDSNDKIWIATEGSGLWQLSRDLKSFTRFSLANGLPSNNVYKVLEDNYKTLWISTSKGLVSMDSTMSNVNVYTSVDGLLTDEFNYNSGFKDKNGRLYFGSIKGMIAFNPALVPKNTFVPFLHITNFQVENKDLPIDSNGILKKSILYTDKITLQHNQSSFNIDFSAISYTSPEKTKYSYILEGLDNAWTTFSANRRVYFTNLKPGDYTFILKASNTDFSSPTEKRLYIKILPPFWQTWWAYLIYFMSAGMILFYILRSYLSFQESKKAKEIIEAKIEFFTHIAHEIRTPLTLIKAPVDNLSEKINDLPDIKEDVLMMERNTNRLINLVNQVLDFRQTEVKAFSLYFNAVNISELLEENFTAFKPLADKRNLNYQMQLHPSAIHTMADIEALNKIFSNLFSNAVKYAAGKVTIKMEKPAQHESSLKIEIANDGFIIPNEMAEKIFEPFIRMKATRQQSGTGIGLALARSLTVLHGGTLQLQTIDEMNNFILIIPYKPV